MIWRELDHETQAFGLATTGGTVSNTGVVGLTLGGGLGWLMGKHGLAVDNLISADVVTADGQFRTASAAEHPDLFWALRGGGGNFGVVTSAEYRLHEVSQVLGGLVLFPLDQARDVLLFYRDFCGTLPDEAEAYLALLTAPQGMPVVALILGYNGPIAEGEKVLAPARRFGKPIADLVGPMPYSARQKMLDDPNATHGFAAVLALGLHRANSGRVDRRAGGRRFAIQFAAERDHLLLYAWRRDASRFSRHGICAQASAVGCRSGRAMGQCRRIRRSHRLGQVPMGQDGAAPAWHGLRQSPVV